MLRCTVRVVRQYFALEHASASHACSFEASMREILSMPFGSPLSSRLTRLNYVAILKDDGMWKALGTACDTSGGYVGYCAVTVCIATTCTELADNSGFSGDACGLHWDNNCKSKCIRNEECKSVEGAMYVPLVCFVCVAKGLSRARALPFLSLGDQDIASQTFTLTMHALTPPPPRKPRQPGHSRIFLIDIATAD
jgi:hypothetical protein